MRHAAVGLVYFWGRMAISLNSLCMLDMLTCIGVHAGDQMLACPVLWMVVVILTFGGLTGSMSGVPRRVDLNERVTLCRLIANFAPWLT